MSRLDKANQQLQKGSAIKLSDTWTLQDWLAAEDAEYQEYVSMRQLRQERLEREREGWIETGREMGERINQLESELAALRQALDDAPDHADVDALAFQVNSLRQAVEAAEKLGLKWEYEDEIEGDLTTEMYLASIVDVVRLYPYIERDGEKFYLGAYRAARRGEGA